MSDKDQSLSPVTPATMPAANPQSTETKRSYLFSVEDAQDGVRVEFTTPDTQEDSMSAVDTSMVVLALFKMLKESGMTSEQISTFMGNILQEIGVIEEHLVDSKEEIDVKKEEEN